MAKKRKKSQKIQVYPCVVYELQDYNPEYAQGFRYRVHDQDDDLWYFRTQERMWDMLRVHAMHPVTPEQMEDIRKQRAKQQGL